MQQMTDSLKIRAKHKTTTLLLFAYGIVAGTSAPILLSRCVGSNCGACSGFCGLTLGVLPVILFVYMKSRVRYASQYVLSVVRKTGSH